MWRLGALLGASVVAAALGLALAQQQGPPSRPAGGPKGRPYMPANVGSYMDLQYGGGANKAQTLDLFVPTDAKAPLPVVVWIHGGAWTSGSKRPCDAARFTARGYAAASVEYRMSQEAKFPAQIHDCKAAIRFLRANARKYNLDPDRIGVWGSSAGGHLVALLGTTADVPELEGDGPNKNVSSAVQAVCDWFGPTDMLQMSKFPSNIRHDDADSPESRLIGAPIQEAKDKAAAANPITYIKKGKTYPPFLIMHGDKDALVPFNQSELLADALKAAGAEATFYPVKNGGHGKFSDPKVQGMVDEFFDKCLKAPKPTSASAPTSAGM